MLYKQSGLLGISGISNDMRDLLGSSDRRPVSRWTTSSIVRPRRSAVWPLCSVALTPSCSPPE